METVNEFNVLLDRLNINNGNGQYIPPSIPEGEEDKLITLYYRLDGKVNSLQIHPCQEAFYRELIRELQSKVE